MYRSIHGSPSGGFYLTGMFLLPNKRTERLKFLTGFMNRYISMKEKRKTLSVTESHEQSWEFDC